MPKWQKQKPRARKSEFCDKNYSMPCHHTAPPPPPPTNTYNTTPPHPTRCHATPPSPPPPRGAGSVRHHLCRRLITAFNLRQACL